MHVLVVGGVSSYQLNVDMARISVNSQKWAPAVQVGCAGLSLLSSAGSNRLDFWCRAVHRGAKLEGVGGVSSRDRDRGGVFGALHKPALALGRGCSSSSLVYRNARGIEEPVTTSTWDLVFTSWEEPSSWTPSLRDALQVVADLPFGDGEAWLRYLDWGEVQRSIGFMSVYEPTIPCASPLEFFGAHPDQFLIEGDGRLLIRGDRVPEFRAAMEGVRRTRAQHPEARGWRLVLTDDDGENLWEGVDLLLLAEDLDDRLPSWTEDLWNLHWPRLAARTRFTDRQPGFSFLEWVQRATSGELPGFASITQCLDSGAPGGSGCVSHLYSQPGVWDSLVRELSTIGTRLSESSE
jgi:hypothetical protein